MARILARFSPEMVVALAELGQFADPGDTAHIAHVLEQRLQLILRRYLTRLPPLADFRVEGGQLCGVDLARARKLQPEGAYEYRATSEAGQPLAVTIGVGGAFCVTLPRSEKEYERVRIRSSAAQGVLVAHLYAFRAGRFRLAGLERLN